MAQALARDPKAVSGGSRLGSGFLTLKDAFWGCPG